ncbi:MAG TPA: (Fe-S)-binding protein [Bryobacteraceae bacterium]|jgi:glycolate oxidase iron-sulfur subunit
MAASDKPQTKDLDKCVHCGLCLNACPTYRELGLEMDSPRGRIYQMVQVSIGKAKLDDSYVEHLDLCLACRACESACPSGVPYGRLIEAARTEIADARPRPLLMRLAFRHLLPSRFNLQVAARMLWLYQASGLQAAARKLGLIPKSLAAAESLSPPVEMPSFFGAYGKTFPAEGMKKYRVAMLGGCMANVTFARLHEATVRVLQKNGCEVVIPENQTCCGALHVHAGCRDEGRALARKNIDALAGGGYDAIITNTAGCGSTLKEYDELLEHDDAYREKAKQFKALVRDVNEFLASIELNRDFGAVPVTATYQDSCHLAHGQKIRNAPRQLLRAIPGLKLKEMRGADVCCGSAGIYNILHTDLSLQILDSKMKNAASTKAEWIVTANPGCMLQLRAGVTRCGSGQRVLHVIEALDAAYAAAKH